MQVRRLGVWIQEGDERGQDVLPGPLESKAGVAGARGGRILSEAADFSDQGRAIREPNGVGWNLFARLVFLPRARGG